MTKNILSWLKSSLKSKTVVIQVYYQSLALSHQCLFYLSDCYAVCIMILKLTTLLQDLSVCHIGLITKCLVSLKYNWSSSKHGTLLHSVPDNKIHGANMGPIWGRQDRGGPHVGPVNLAIWGALKKTSTVYFKFQTIHIHVSILICSQNLALYWK